MSRASTSTNSKTQTLHRFIWGRSNLLELIGWWFRSWWIWPGLEKEISGSDFSGWRTKLKNTFVLLDEASISATVWKRDIRVSKRGKVYICLWAGFYLTNTASVIERNVQVLYRSRNVALVQALSGGYGLEDIYERCEHRIKVELTLIALYSSQTPAS